MLRVCLSASGTNLKVRHIAGTLQIIFIFGRCHHSLAVVPPAKYESDSKRYLGKTRNITNINLQT